MSAHHSKVNRLLLASIVLCGAYPAIGAGFYAVVTGKNPVLELCAPLPQELPTPPRARIIQMMVTAYCPCEICTGKTEPWDERTTSLMDPATIYDGVAAAYNLLPRRTLLFIPNAGELIIRVKEVDDTGDAMNESAKCGVWHIDLRVPSHEIAKRFGVRWLPVTILESRERTVPPA